MSNVSVQLLAANGILGRDRGAVMHALALDPYTAMTLTLPEIRHMVDALFEAQARWLPAFAPSVSAIRAA
jgi:alpha-galactosidase/6-phospho-beta-glucosidase family protein